MPSFTQFGVLLAFGLSCSANVLNLRQSASDLDITKFPETCRDVCEEPVAKLKQCDGSSDTASCICNNDFADQYARCVSCLVKETNGVVTEAQGQVLVDGIVNGCDQAGSSIDHQDVDLGDDFSDNDGSSSILAETSVVSTLTTFLLGAGFLIL